MKSFDRSTLQRITNVSRISAFLLPSLFALRYARADAICCG
jgi:hypothetical protein